MWFRYGWERDGDGGGGGDGGEAARRNGARTSQTQTHLVVLLGELLNERLGLGGAGLDLALERRWVRDGAAREFGVGLDDLAVLDRLFDLEHGEDHRDREPHGGVGELETRADAVYACQQQRTSVCVNGKTKNSPATEAKDHRARVRLTLVTRARDEPLGLV